MRQALNGAARVGFAYDALSQLTEEVQRLSYGSGHVHQITVDGHVISDIERDALHRETSRTQGALQSQYGFDPMGRLAAHKGKHAANPY